jgi:uncharacterized protein
MNQIESEIFIEKLKLRPHPEGGYFSELYRSQKSFASNGVTRPLSTSIYFLLKSDQVSKFHQLTSDEIWYYHSGSTVTVYMIDSLGIVKEEVLGCNINKGEHPQILIEAGTIFGAIVNELNSYTLMGCSVTPGFDFRDFKLFKKDELVSSYPQHKAIIEKLT